MSPRDIIAGALPTAFKDAWADEIIAKLHAAGYRILAPEEDDAATWARANDAAVKAAWSALFGPPSMWGGDRPHGWHLDEPCTPELASHHDNGCIDASLAIRALRESGG